MANAHTLRLSWYGRLVIHDQCRPKGSPGPQQPRTAPRALEGLQGPLRPSGPQGLLGPLGPLGHLEPLGPLGTLEGACEHYKAPWVPGGAHGPLWVLRPLQRPGADPSARPGGHCRGAATARTQTCCESCGEFCGEFCGGFGGGNFPLVSPAPFKTSPGEKVVRGSFHNMVCAMVGAMFSPCVSPD